MKRSLFALLCSVMLCLLLYTSAFAGESKWNRIAGDDAVITCGAVAVEYVEPNFSPEKAILVSIDGYWDALTAAGLSGMEDAPVILSHKDDVGKIGELLHAFRVKNIIIVGGESAISDMVVAQVKRLITSPAVTRIAGADASDTAVEVYKRVLSEGKSWGNVAIVVTTSGFYDALSASPYSYAKKAPLFLADPKNGLSESAVAAIKQGGFKEVLILGGTAAVPSKVSDSQLKGIKCTRIAGDDAIDTSIAMAKRCLADGMDMSHVGVATSSSYYDGVCGGPLCGKKNSPLVLINDNDTSAIDELIAPHSAEIKNGYIFGGTAAVSSAVEAKLRAA